MLEVIQAIGAAVSMVLAQAHWASAYADLQARYEVAEARNAAYQKELREAEGLFKEFSDKVLRDANLEKLADLKTDDNLDARLKKIKGALKDAYDEKANRDKLREELAVAQRKLDAEQAALVSARAEAEKRQAEVKDMRDLLAKEDKRFLEMEKELAQEHDERVLLKIRADALELRAKELEKENDKLASDNQKLIISGGSSATPKKDGPNPPGDAVEGQISEVNPSGLVRITIGSDAGLAKGDTLEVYRLNAKVPEQSKYVGRIKIVEVKNTEALGQMIGKPVTTPQTGDTVSGKILDK